ncbi:MAG: cell division protein FtsA [Clostridia bacterium]|jgi:cell division protein FtsA|nr:cell division protein FtsA [Clostridia bacterium]
MNEQELIFSMDIGTRSIVGIVGCHDGEKFNIMACEIEEHKERAMYDGQVHDIELVALAAGRVKQRLEEKLGIKLTNVAIAAAGRSLKTHKVFIERNVDNASEVERDTISSLEIEAIQKSQMEIEEMQHEDGQQYYCVGYAVVNYYLNGSVIGNLEGHKANNIGIEVLATFLPKIVVDSLYSVVSRVNLEVSSLTLEPIAAMNVCIQSNLRLLNIALVDIGAGTSDIALTKNGSVYAFAMVPVAGDEITERLSETYLLDFDTAEKVKIELCAKDKLEFKDIMENQLQLSAEEIITAIEPSIEQLAQSISEKILEYNGKAPSAVFLVGGGSQIPRLNGYLAEKLQIPLERVGLRKTSLIKEINLKDHGISGPEFITPIGIAVTAHLNRQKDFLNVYVNDKSIKLFNSKALNVADALILVGFNPRNLIGRRGLPVTFTLNHKVEMIKGEPGEPARIFLNGAQSALDKVLSNGDRIVIDPAVDGKSAEVYIRNYSSLLKGKIIYANNLEKSLPPTIMVNGKLQGADYKIQDNDVIEIKTINTVEELLSEMNVDTEGISIEINNKKAEKSSSIYNGDHINWSFIHTHTAKNLDAAPSKTIVITLNGKQLLIEQNKDSMMFLDIFNHMEIDVTKIKGINTLKLNGNNANYTDIIKSGDMIEVQWEN